MTKQIHGTPYWTKLAQWWQKVAPPVRPSKSDIKVYEGFLKRTIGNKGRPKVLIFGATPEMRDLAAKYKAETTVCDISSEMIMAMCQLMSHKKAGQKEIWVRASWVTAPLRHNYYDVILGEGVTTNVSWKESNQWWKHLTELLKSKGAFITRMVYFPPKKEIDKTLNAVIKKILKRKNPSAVDFSELKIVLEIVNYNLKTGTCSNARYKELFFKHVKNFPVSRTKANKIYRKLIKIYPPRPIKVWRLPTKIQSEKEAKKHFRIAAGVPAPSLPIIGTIYFLKKK